MNDSVVVLYNGEPVSVPKEVAEFLDQERKREQAQDKRDERHLSRSEFETVLSCLGNTDPPVEETAIQALQLETLRKAVQKIGRPGAKPDRPALWSGADHGGDREALRHLENGGIKAAEKAPRKAEELCHMTGLPSFFLSLGLLFISSALVHTGWEQNFFQRFSIFWFTNCF